MLRGLRHVLGAAKRAGVSKLIHLGSTAIYGFDPSPGSEHETAPPRPASKYGELKLKQDELVLAAHGGGMSTRVLCPPNIAGPYSPFVLGAVDLLQSGRLVLVDGGQHPANLVHVDNLVEAILTAVRSDGGWGERYFINSTVPQTWKACFEALGQVVGWPDSVRSITREEVLASAKTDTSRATLKDNLRVLVSGEFRRAVATLPALRSGLDGLASLFGSLPPATQQRLRQRLRSRTVIRPESDGLPLDHLCIRAQVSRVHHSTAKLVETLGYQPALDAATELETTAQWLRFIGRAQHEETVGVV
jgi:dTDP-4-dehydrorhamnose reductase